MQLDDRFYTSTEVAEILGVSLRSVYRYLEDGKLDAEVKTATGRHRFTRKNILDFLYPQGEESSVKSSFPNSDVVSSSVNPEKKEEITSKVEVARPVVSKPVATHATNTELEDDKPSEEIDWLSKFREAAAKFKRDQEEQQTVIKSEPAVVATPIAEPVPSKYEEPRASKTIEYYRSMLGGLKDIAQNIDKNARESRIDYAFTMNAGLSLHKPIKPFAMLHVYLRNEHRDYYEKVLRLTPSDQSNAQLCVIYTNNDNLFASKEEVHGLYVVSRLQLQRDVNEMGDSSLIQELDAVFS